MQTKSFKKVRKVKTDPVARPTIIIQFPKDQPEEKARIDRAVELSGGNMADIGRRLFGEWATLVLANESDIARAAKAVAKRRK